MKVHFVRHGMTEANVKSQFQGQSDTPLTEAGKRNIVEVTQAFNEHEYDITFSSPLKRALDTAKLFSQQLETDIRISPELREICYGDWEGQRKEELRDRDIWKQREENKYNFTHPGEYNGIKGQSYAEIFEQFDEFFNQLLQSEYNFVLVVTHLGVLRNARKYFEDCSDKKAVSFTPDIRQVYEVSIEDDHVNTTIMDLK
jgi:broad specificity phosphatase PhoE